MGWPFPSLLLIGNIVFQLVGSISPILGLKVQWVAVILIIFLYHFFLETMVKVKW